MTEKTKSDNVARKIFDSHYALEWNEDNLASIESTLGQIRKIKPHAVYYPSVGMSLPAILLANLRLAPIQIMSLGHPASTHSSVMDYCLVEQQYLADSSLFSETIIQVSDGAFGFVPHADQPDRNTLLALKQQPVSGQPLRIAIPAAAMKINAGFVAVLQQIRHHCSRTIEWHFFPYLNQTASALFRKQLEQLLPGSVVHPPMDYGAYLAAIGACELHLSPFPFSSTNSLIDSLLLGLPLVVKEVTETEACVDAAMVRRLGLESLQPQSTVEGYVNLACRLIDDESLRAKISGEIRALDIENLFYQSHTSAAMLAAEQLYEKVMLHDVARQHTADCS